MPKIATYGATDQGTGNPHEIVTHLGEVIDPRTEDTKQADRENGVPDIRSADSEPAPVDKDRALTGPAAGDHERAGEKSNSEGEKSNSTARDQGDDQGSMGDERNPAQKPEKVAPLKRAASKTTEK